MSPKIRHVTYVSNVTKSVIRSQTLRFVENIFISAEFFKMFKKFDEKESVSGTTQLKSSVQKGIRVKLIEVYPHIEPYIDQILPKKDAFRIVKW